MSQRDVAISLAEKYLWCIICGRQHNDPHHIKFRSRGGKDTEENEIAICRECHDNIHDERINVEREGDRLKVINKKTGEITYRSLKPHVPTEEEGLLAYTLHGKIMDFKQEVEIRFWKLGEALKDMRDQELYKVLGAESFNEYLGFPELSIERSQAYKLISICEQGKRLGLEPSKLANIDKDKLATVLPKATTENVEDILSDCETLSRSDIKEKYKRTGSIERPAGWTEQEFVCSSCGATNRIKVMK